MTTLPDTEASGRSSSSAGPAAAGLSLLVLTYLGFVSLGLPDASYGVAWPSLRETFDLGESAFGAGLLSVGLGVLCSSLSAGTLLRRFGAGRLLTASTALTAAGLAGFALSPNWGFFLAAGLVTGLGGGAIDSGLNAYAASRYSARQMNWLHAAFGFGASLGPLTMAFALAHAGWRPGYLAIAAAMALLALLFFCTRRMWGRSARSGESAAQAVPVGRALRSGVVWLQTATFFVYAGLEVAAGQWAYAVLTQGRGYSVETGGLWTGLFWFALFAGRVLLGFGADAIGARRLVGAGASIALPALIVFAYDPLGLGVVGLVVAGFALAPIFPMLMHRTPQLLGAGLAAHSIGFQVSAAMMGGVALPAIAGFVAAAWGVGAVPFFLCAAAVVHLGLVAAGLRRDALEIATQDR